MNTRKENGRLGSFVRPTLWGLVAGALVCAALLLLMAIAMTVWDVPQRMLVPLATVAAAAGALASGFTAACIKKQQGLLLGLVCGALLYVAIWLTGLGYLGEIQWAAALIRWLILMACGAVGGILGVNLRRRPHHR